jgi:hypothetical protein
MPAMTTLRTILMALLACLTLGAGVASAANDRTAATGKDVKTQIAPGPKSAALVEGGSTGEGPATDADCEEIAGEINGSLDLMEDAMLADDMGLAGFWSDFATERQDDGEDAGCYFTNVL